MKFREMVLMMTTMDTLTTMMDGMPMIATETFRVALMEPMFPELQARSEITIQASAV